MAKFFMDFISEEGHSLIEAGEAFAEEFHGEEPEDWEAVWTLKVDEQTGRLSVEMEAFWQQLGRMLSQCLCYPSPDFQSHPSASGLELRLKSRVLEIRLAGLEVEVDLVLFLEKLDQLYQQYLNCLRKDYPTYARDRARQRLYLQAMIERAEGRELEIHDLKSSFQVNLSLQSMEQPSDPDSEWIDLAAALGKKLDEYLEPDRMHLQLMLGGQPFWDFYFNPVYLLPMIERQIPRGLLGLDAGLEGVFWDFLNISSGEGKLELTALQFGSVQLDPVEFARQLTEAIEGQRALCQRLRAEGSMSRGDHWIQHAFLSWDQLKNQLIARAKQYKNLHKAQSRAGAKMDFVFAAGGIFSELRKKEGLPVGLASDLGNICGWWIWKWDGAWIQFPCEWRQVESLMNGLMRGEEGTWSLQAYDTRDYRESPTLLIATDGTKVDFVLEWTQRPLDDESKRLLGLSFPEKLRVPLSDLQAFWQDL